MKAIQIAQVIFAVTSLSILSSCDSMKSSSSTPTPTVETEKSHGMAKPEVKKAM